MSGTAQNDEKYKNSVVRLGCGLIVFGQFSLAVWCDYLPT